MGLGKINKYKELGQQPKTTVVKKKNNNIDLETRFERLLDGMLKFFKEDNIKQCVVGILDSIRNDKDMINFLGIDENNFDKDEVVKILKEEVTKQLNDKVESFTNELKEENNGLVGGKYISSIIEFIKKITDSFGGIKIDIMSGDVISLHINVVDPTQKYFI